MWCPMCYVFATRKRSDCEAPTAWQPRGNLFAIDWLGGGVIVKRFEGSSISAI